jgi:hypothetical protein
MLPYLFLWLNMTKLWLKKMLPYLKLPDMLKDLILLKDWLMLWDQKMKDGLTLL